MVSTTADTLQAAAAATTTTTSSSSLPGALSPTRRRATTTTKIITPSTSPPPLWPRILAGSIGSIVTALAVTPLEVVKVRQQMASASSTATATTTRVKTPPTRPCPSCGTIVFHNGLMECVVTRKSVMAPTPAIITSTSSMSNFSTNININVSQGTATPKLGTFGMLRQIFLQEGFVGIYAGLSPTLVMSVPNTVLYFTAYDELVTRFHDYSIQKSYNAYTNTTSTTNNTIAYGEPPQYAFWIPLVSGSLARLLATLSTAPLELIRTRQAAAAAASTIMTIQNQQKLKQQQSLGQELMTLVRYHGLSSLFQGLAPTLYRDVPFSAIYWFCLEKFKVIWRESSSHHKSSSSSSPLQHAGQAFCNGAGAGMIAAACTTPFDVIKTRQQVTFMNKHNNRSNKTSARNTASTQYTSSSLPPRVTISSCHHNGAIAATASHSITATTTTTTDSTFGILRQVVQEEGIAGLWRGNTTRMIKVAPACAIMISCYELGKVLLS